jgi:prolyl oligopeptidase
MKKMLFPILALGLNACSSNNEEVQATESDSTIKKVKQEALKYPETKKVDTLTNYFGTEVQDPYRWLEDDLSEETADWVKRQNELTFSYLDKIPYRSQIEEKLEKLWNYEKVGSPFKEGDYTYFYKNDGLQNQYVVYRKKDGGKEEVFLDPNTFSEDGTTSLGGLSFSRSGKLAAYAISEGGSDWRKVIVIDAETKEQIEDTLVDIKFSGISWYKDEGFYYSSYDKPKGSELSAKTDQHKLYYHKMGTKQSSDKLIFGGTADQKRRYVGGYVSDDDRYLFISGSQSTSGNELYLMNLENGGGIVSVVEGFDSDSYVMETQGDSLYIATNLDAPNKRVVLANSNNPTPENWTDFIPERDMVLSPSTGSGYFFASYMKDAISVIEQYDYQGVKIRDVKLPGVGTANGMGGKKEEETIYYSFTNYITPGSIYTYNPTTGESTKYWEPDIAFDSDMYESKQVFYTSKDGTQVPMIISYKKGLTLDGSNPTILYGYGGFNVSLTPSFSVTNAVWMDMGGIYAVANLRGGGEYGKEWHDAGTQMKKQNVFDDFIAAGEYLQAEGYTCPQRMAVRGGSNGGLLVGATMTQRPDLMAVALPAVGVLDMLRYHTFTAGAGWAYDYGTSADSKEMFDYLLGYSPVHNVKKGVEYPATMVTTGDHDDRVVPAHSFKFAAELQDKQSGTNPTLIRIETNAGHGAGTPVSKTIAQTADIYGFTLWNMGIEELK